MSQATVSPGPSPRIGQSPFSALDRRKHAGLSSRSSRLTHLPASSNSKHTPHLRHHSPPPSKRKAPTQIDGGVQTTAGPASAAAKAASRADSEALRLYDNIQAIPDDDGVQQKTSLRSTIALPLPPQQDIHAESPVTTVTASSARNLPVSVLRPSGNAASWDGEQPEDQLSEQVIRDGYSNKPKVQNEMGSARASLWPHLKAAPALTSLSSAFVLALQQRQDRDVVTAASTFKPPPRVTLTDARKTAWLSELADDSIPLRRLSRTIPHGVRGRVLLEQCLQNRIPIARAMWLVKCVGANELRAFRRKGVSDSTVLDNEQKWVLEWTGHVERFLAEPTRGQDVAYASFQYALQIAFRIFAEGLVDREHFLGSLYASVQLATVDDLPFALLKVECWLDTILSDFKHAYWTVHACMSRMSEIARYSKRDIFQPLWNRLQKLSHGIRSHCPLSSLSFQPEDVSPPSPLQTTTLNEDLLLIHVNDLMIHSLRKKSVRLDMTINFTEKLDHCLKGEPSKLEEPLMGLVCRKHSSMHDLLTNLLEWAASPLWPGASRVYAGLRLLRSLQRKGFDVKSLFIRALGEVASSLCISASKLSHLVAELVRAKDIDTSVYLRWLVSNGAMDSHQQASQVHSTILMNLPTRGLSDGVVNLLNRIRSVPNQKEQMLEAKRTLSIVKRTLRHQGPSNRVKTDTHDFGSVISPHTPWAVKFDISDELQEFLKSGPQTKQQQQQQQHHHHHNLAIDQVLTILEASTDEIALVFMINAQIPTANSDLVKRLCDETASHRQSFAALGKLDALRVILVRRYHNLKAVEMLDKELATRLLVLARAQPKNEQLERHLIEEIERYDQRPGIAAQTPMSDGGAVCDSDNVESHHAEDLQAIFGKHTSNQSFCVSVVKGLEYAAMNKLDRAQVAAVAKASLERALSGQSERSSVSLVSTIAGIHAGGHELGGRTTLFFLWAYNVLPVGDMFSMLDIACRAGIDKALVVCIDALEVFAACEQGEQALEWPVADPIPARIMGSFQLQVSLFLEQHARGVLSMLLSLIDKAATASVTDFTRLKTICGSDLVLSLNCHAFLGTDADLQSFLEPAVRPDLSDEARVCLQTLLLRLIDPDGIAALSARSVLETIQFMLQNVNGSSACTSRACLPLLIKLQPDADLESTASRASILDIVHAAMREHKLAWASLLDALPPPLNIANDARSAAESALLARHGVLQFTDSFANTPSSFLLDVVRATAASASTSAAADVTARATERFNALAAGASESEGESAGATTETHAAADPDALVTDLTHLILIHHDYKHDQLPSAQQPQPQPQPHTQQQPASSSSSSTAALSSSPPAFLRALAILSHAAPTTQTTAPPAPRLAPATRLLARATLSFFALELARPARAALASSMPPALLAADPELRMLLGANSASASSSAGTDAPPTSRLILRSGTGASAPFVRSAWEMPPDAGGEETSVGLRMFGARRRGEA